MVGNRLSYPGSIHVHGLMIFRSRDQWRTVYDDYLAKLAQTKPEDLAVSAVSIIGLRDKVAKLVKNLGLLR